MNFTGRTFRVTNPMGDLLGKLDVDGPTAALIYVKLGLDEFGTTEIAGVPLDANIIKAIAQMNAEQVNRRVGHGYSFGDFTAMRKLYRLARAAHIAEVKIEVTIH